MTKQIYAHYDEEGIYVYQAFKPEIVSNALEKGTFGKGFNMERMTWIKPSFGWMLYRSRYATKHRQEAILKIKITHEGFQKILGCAAPTLYCEDLYSNQRQWRDELKKSSVRYQWDPDRDLQLYKLRRRAIQIGMRGETVENYVNKWIIGLEDVTALAHEIKKSLRTKNFPQVPEEIPYKIADINIRKRLQIDDV